MQGRYGVDDFGKFLVISGAIINLLGNFKYLWILKVLGLGIIVYAFYRIFSKKVHLRLAENRKYLVYQNSVIKKYNTISQQYSQRSTHKFYKCKSCRQAIRVPKGRGKIEITCPKCHTKFIKKT